MAIKGDGGPVVMKGDSGAVLMKGDGGAVAMKGDGGTVAMKGRMAATGGHVEVLVVREWSLRHAMVLAPAARGERYIQLV